MLTTKQFADLCKTTKRTIIHYDQIGLLHPVKKEKLNRYYTTRQVLTFEKIALLQSVGFPLQTIKHKLKSRQSLIKIFEENKRKITEQQRRINTQMKKIDEILNNLEKNKNLLDPKIKIIKQHSFYGIEKEGRYADIPLYCKELSKRISDKKRIFTYFVIFKEFIEEEYSPTNSLMIICARPPKKTSLLPKKNVIIFHNQKHKALTSLHNGSHASLGYIWKHMWEYFKKNKLVYDNQTLVREVYLMGPQNEKYEENYVTELQIPIIPK